MKGRFPAILDHPKYGAAARELYDHARTLLDRIVRDRLLTPRGVYGFWPAQSDGEDIIVFEPGSWSRDPGSGMRDPGFKALETHAPVPDPRSRSRIPALNKERLRFNMLRQQEEIADGKPNRSLADFVAPRESGIVDSIGAFAVTAGHRRRTSWPASFERDLDDYHAIMVKALADRLAEAFAEYLHARARRDWGYGAGEQLTGDDLIAERYRGIRPAFGYPACPDHSEKRKLFELLGAERAGISLTENFAMAPAASVSGLYFAHPEAKYFNVGRLGPDQVEDYARRKGVGARGDRALAGAKSVVTSLLASDSAIFRLLPPGSMSTNNGGADDDARRLFPIRKKEPSRNGRLEVRRHARELAALFVSNRTPR